MNLEHLELKESFKVGEVFQHRNDKLTPLHFGGNFRDWVWNPAQCKVVSLGAFSTSILKEYLFPKNMNDIAIQNEAKSALMEEDQFWAMLYFLIIDPKLGKRILKYELRKNKVYIFHVKLASDKIVAVRLYWSHDDWILRASVFGVVGPWLKGGVFVHLISV